jgi:hypothetical protein
MIDTTAPPQRYTVLTLDRSRHSTRLAAGSEPLESGTPATSTVQTPAQSKATSKRS